MIEFPTLEMIQRRGEKKALLPSADLCAASVRPAHSMSQRGAAEEGESSICLELTFTFTHTIPL